jgi:CHAT domain-containing protein/tetratricopeptide (TPR) repeat protein
MCTILAREVAAPMFSCPRSQRSISLLTSEMVAFFVLTAAPASALTMEEAVERCRESVGRPIVQSCMRGQSQAQLESCKTQATPQVRACVVKALNAANGRANTAVEIPKEKKADIKIDLLNAGFVAPPRSIKDIAAILDAEKPDPGQIGALKAEADAKVPSVPAHDLAWFYYTRGNARAQLGRISEAIEDANKAMEVGRGTVDAYVMGRLQQFAGLQYAFAGNPKQALAIFERQIRDTNAQGSMGYLFGGYRQISGLLIQAGDIEQADAYLRRNLSLIQEARTSGKPLWRSYYAIIGQSWEGEIEYQRAMIFEARGQFREAEAAYLQAELRWRASVKGVLSIKNAPPEDQVLQTADLLVLGQAKMKARQGRLAEAEADARRALLARLKGQGKYHSLTPRYIMGLADVLVEQGRYGEAETLARVSLEITRTVGVAKDSQNTAQLLSTLGAILNLQRKTDEAAEVYAELDKSIAKWDSQRRQALELNSSRISSLFASGQIEAGLAAAQALLKREISRVGEKHFDTAVARGTLAVGYKQAGKQPDAVREFKAAIPMLMSAARENADDDETSAVAARQLRLQYIIEAYIDLLAGNLKDPGDAVAIETFRLADAIRGQSVQQALAASSARMIAKDPALSELIRKEQDLSKQISAQLGGLNNMLSLASAERDEIGVRAINATIDKARAERVAARAEIGRRFPAYADLIDPRPPTVESIRAAMRQGEALLSFYFGRERSFVWAVPKDGPVAFAVIEATAGEVETKVRKLREAVESDVQFISDIPPYDLALAYELYSMLLKPIEGAWKPAKNLIVVTNGALGLLPLSLLPTAPSAVSEGSDLPFIDYRKVPWLMRTHAVTMVPSVAALRTLRQLPPGSEKREPLIGFGDPYFSVEQASAAELHSSTAPIEVAAATRGLPLHRRAVPQTSSVDSADLALLPRLPDTAEELKSIALSLQVDPSKVLYLGKDANERRVKDTDLTRFRIVAFSTHGLVPGDLNGLTLPALALTAPKGADVDGDGLLTMEEVLALRLDSDWVVLSACNTGTGAGAGAEAVSGLGRAFFYAGTRALLVTNWAVHSASARELVTDLFHRQAADAKLPRAEALRQAMEALMDGPGYAESGKTLFAYAHPMFWAPYTVIGDGGGQAD